MSNKITTTQLFVIVSLAAIFGLGGYAMIFFNTHDINTTVKNETVSLPSNMVESSKTQEVIPERTSPSKDVTKYPNTTIKKIDENFNIKTTSIKLNVPENNVHPWGTVEGTVSDAAPGHPVIIQFFKSLEDGPVHVAQVELDKDNTFDYKVRLFSIDDAGNTIHIFKGEYIVKIITVAMAE